MKFAILADPSLVIIAFILNLSDQCPSVDKKRRNIACSLYDHGIMTITGPCPGDHEIYNFGGPFLGHYYYTLSLFDLSLGVEKTIFKEIMYFQYILNVLIIYQYLFKLHAICSWIKIYQIIVKNSCFLKIQQDKKEKKNCIVGWGWGSPLTFGT